MFKTTVLFSALVLLAAGGAMAGDDVTPDYLEGTGFQGRIDHIEGTGIPQIFPITPIQLFPYAIYDQSLFFADMRVYPTNYFTVGGNVGLGYRYYSEGLDRVFGISGWYDGDNTRSVLFQQLGLGLESYAGPFDVRSNLYWPVGPISRQTGLSVVPGSTQFQGDNLVFNQLRTWITAMKGFDAEIGRLLPGDLAEQYGIRIYGGGYHFSDSSGDSITGGSARLQANLMAGLDMQGQVTYDNFFKGRAFLGISYTFGALHRSEMKQTTSYGRIGEHVTRNYTVVAEGHSQLEHKTAIDPATGSPYTFAHVLSTAGPGGNGTVNNPFQTIAAAQLAGRDIIFVHANSAFTNNIVLNPGDRIMGDGSGIQHFIQIPELGSLLLPQGAGALPTLTVSAGNALTLANNTSLSGFVISTTNPGGSGVFGSAVQNVSLDHVFINGTGGDGIQLLNTAGSISISNALIKNAGGSGINIVGGTGAIQFLGTTTVSGSGTVGGAPGVLIDQLAAGGSVSFGNLNVDHRLGVGLEISSLAGAVSVSGTTNISNESSSTASAIDITNATGNSNFNAVNVSNAMAAAGTGAVNLNGGSGTASFSTLNIAATSGTALWAHGVGNLVINPAASGVVNLLQGGSIVAADGTALDIQNTNLNVNLSSVSSNHLVPGGVGISLVDTTGTLAVYGNGTAGSGGTIQNAAIGILLQDAGISGFRFMNINANGIGIQSAVASQLILASSNVTNSATYGIDAMNTSTMLVANSVFSGNGAANIHGQFSQAGSYSYNFTGSQFTSGSGDNIVLANPVPNATLNLLAQGDTFTNTLGNTAGIRVNWNGSVSATIDHSNFIMSAANNTGLLIVNTSTSALSNIGVTNNKFSATGSFDTGVNISTASLSQLNIANNLVQLSGASGTGFQLAMGPSSIANLLSNTITDSAGGATGVLFSSIAGPSIVTINDNLLKMTSSGILQDQGIVFSGLSGTIQLIGTQENVITNAATPVLIPIGTTTGGFLVNGSIVP